MLFTTSTVDDVRKTFRELKRSGEFVRDKSGCKTLEIVSATFIADEDHIFGEVNRDYVERELEWYRLMSLNVNDIPGGAPAAWKACADPNGYINSNYGWAIWSAENHNQYEHVLSELRGNPDSRRAVMIYTRPQMWNDYNANGMSDFMCTNTVQYMIRDHKLLSIVSMRSNDVVFGYRNDKAWQDVVHSKLASELSLEVGPMVWNASSLHIYERHFKYVE